MSSSLPRVDGYEGPFSLKAFLHLHFNVELRYSQTTSCPSHASTTTPSLTAAASASRNVQGHSILHLTSSPLFAVSVYVAKGAVPPALTSTLSCNAPFASAPLSSGAAGALGERGGASASLRFMPDQQRLLPSFHSNGRGGGGGGKWPASSCALLLTPVPLRHPLFHSLFSFLGPAGCAFICACCPFVVQFEATGGGLQVLGPSLYETAASAVDASTSTRKKYYHDGSAAVRRRPRERGEEEREKCADGLLRKRFRAEGKAPGNQPGPAELAHIPKPQLPSLSGLLGRTVVPQGALVSGPCAAGCLALPVAVGDGGGRRGASRLQEEWLYELWLQRHSRSRELFVTSTLLSPAQSRRARKRSSGGAVAAAALTAQPHKGSSPSDDDDASVPSDDLLLAIFPYTLSIHETASGLAPSSASAAAITFLSSHLRCLVKETMSQCASLDLRGAALRHTAFLERRCHALFAAQRAALSSAAAATVHMSHLMAPVDIVVSYLHDLLGRLVYRSEVAKAGARVCESFWGVDKETGDQVLFSVCRVLKDWLMLGGGTACGEGLLLSSFLHGTPVAKIPWLAGLYTDAKSPKGRAHRSMLQQRVFLQFIFFLTQQVVPFFIRRSFHVTWGPKGRASSLLFVPIAVWRRVLRHQVRFLRAERSPATTNGGSADSTPRPMQLELLSRETERKEPIQLATEEEKGASVAPILYASVRFLPDKKKLRPIAVVKYASHRALSSTARGMPNRYSARYRLAMRLTAGLNPVHLPFPSSKSTSSTTPAIGGFDTKKQTQAPHAAPSLVLRRALLCLTHGIEERRRGAQANDGLAREGSREGLNHLPELRANSSHAAEYAELRAFAAAMRRLEAESRDAKGRVCLHVVRGDAAQCYDRLNQAAVMDAVEKLVRHETYYMLDFHSLRGKPAGAACAVAAAEHAPPLPCATACFHAGPSQPLPALQRMPWGKLLSDADIALGMLPGIPAGWVVQERAAPRWGHLPHSSCRSNGEPQHRGAGSCGSGRLEEGQRVWSGAAIRTSLAQHVHHHLVTVDGRLYRQQRGVVQGSPVAMLLCEVLLLHVDASLAAVLAEHHEPSLQLRRVDDVLVASASAVAAQRCLQEMVHGWPDIGYICQQEKLQSVSSPFSSHTGGHEVADAKAISQRQQRQFVPWCGLLICPNDFTFSVEWARLASQFSTIAQSAIFCCSAWHRGSSLRVVKAGLLSATHRLMSVVCLRTPATVMCRVLNPKERALQTIYEASLVWAHVITRILSSVLSTTFSVTSGTARGLHHRASVTFAHKATRSRWGTGGLSTAAVSLACVTPLLSTSLHACVQRLRRLLTQHQRLLASQASFCDDIAAAEVALCAAAALFCTLQRHHTRSSRRANAVASERRSCGEGKLARVGGGRSSRVWWLLLHVARGYVNAYAAKMESRSLVDLLWPSARVCGAHNEERAGETRKKREKGKGEKVVTKAPCSSPFTQSAWAATHPFLA